MPWAIQSFSRHMRSRAVDKNGAGRVPKISFQTKCRRGACEPKAVDKNGKAHRRGEEDLPGEVRAEA